MPRHHHSRSRKELPSPTPILAVTIGVAHFAPLIIKSAGSMSMSQTSRSPTLLAVVFVALLVVSRQSSHVSATSSEVTHSANPSAARRRYKNGGLVGAGFVLSDAAQQLQQQVVSSTSLASSSSSLVGEEPNAPRNTSWEQLEPLPSAVGEQEEEEERHHQVVGSSYAKHRCSVHPAQPPAANGLLDMTNAGKYPPCNDFSTCYVGKAKYAKTSGKCRPQCSAQRKKCLEGAQPEDGHAKYGPCCGELKCVREEGSSKSGGITKYGRCVAP